MKKYNVLLFVTGLLGISLYGLLTSNYYVQILMDVSPPFMYARLAIAAALLLYVLVPDLRRYTTKALVGLSGVFMLAVGLISMCSPTLLGQTNMYILLGDSLALIEAGILAIVMSAELPIKKAPFTVKVFEYIPQNIPVKRTIKTYS